MTAVSSLTQTTFAAILLVLLALATMPDAKAQAQGDPERGQSLYRSCQACHGAGGEGSAAMNAPQLAGQYPWYLQRQLQNFRAGVRGGQGDTYGGIMAPMAKSLPDEQAVRDVVSYIATF